MPEIKTFLILMNDDMTTRCDVESIKFLVILYEPLYTVFVHEWTAEKYTYFYGNYTYTTLHIDQ